MHCHCHNITAPPHHRRAPLTSTATATSPHPHVTMGSKYGTIVMGPAGAGKTTFCTAMIQHLKNNRRSCFYINLDPAAEVCTAP